MFHIEFVPYNAQGEEKKTFARLGTALKQNKAERNAEKSVSTEASN